MDSQIAIHLFTAVDRKPSLEWLYVEQGVRRLRVPEPNQDLAVQALDVTWLRAGGTADSLPVVLGRRRNPVAVIARPDKLRVPQVPVALP